MLHLTHLSGNLSVIGFEPLSYILDQDSSYLARDIHIARYLSLNEVIVYLRSFFIIAVVVYL
jgi:hypothetical protein